MADLTSNTCGIRSPNPFWLASARPRTQADKSYGHLKPAGVVLYGKPWSTHSKCVLPVRRHPVERQQRCRANNIELITDRSLEANFKEMAEVKRLFPDHVISSLMVETKEEWKDELNGPSTAPRPRTNFGCPHGMCERGMGSAVGQEPGSMKRSLLGGIQHPSPREAHPKCG